MDATGSREGKITTSVTFAASGGTAPTLSGFVKGALSASGASDILVAHATDPLQSWGDASYSDGFTVASSKLKLFYVQNTHASATLTIARAATNGLPIFEAASDAVLLDASGILLIHKTAGTAALTSATNDALTLTPSAAVTGDILMIYGP